MAWKRLYVHDPDYLILHQYLIDWYCDFEDMGVEVEC